MKDNIYFILNNAKTIFLICNSKYHCYVYKERKWYCDTCTSNCKKNIEFQSIVVNFRQSITTKYTPNYSTVSTIQIPFSLDETLDKKYSEQLSQGITLPPNLIPETDFCLNGYPFNKKEGLVLEHRGIIVYTENDILDLREHKRVSSHSNSTTESVLCHIVQTYTSSYLFITSLLVFSSQCTGPCNCKAVFEGRGFLLLNLNNRYIVHYGLLFDYSELVTLSRNTLHGFVRYVNKIFLLVILTN